MGVVSDALAMCPLADGCIYVIKHNYVKIRQIKSNLKRLTEAALPIVGALMNHVGRSGTGLLQQQLLFIQLRPLLFGLISSGR